MESLPDTLFSVGRWAAFVWTAFAIIVPAVLVLAQRGLLARGRTARAAGARRDAAGAPPLPTAPSRRANVRGVSGTSTAAHRSRADRRAPRTSWQRPADGSSCGSRRAARVAPVSVLRPVRGVDPAFEANLTTLFRQDHPCFEVLVGAADADDPALDVARRVAAAHPHVPSRVVADARRVGLNPKVNNLANLARLARHDTFVVSDSNVAAPTGLLSALAARLDEGTAADGAAPLVWSPIVARPSGSLGAALESLHLNTFVMGGTAAVTRWFGRACCVGKTMAFRRADVEAVGGFEFLGAHLAEDQVCAEEFARTGRGVVLAAPPVENVLGPVTLRDFCSRHLRWARIRRRVSPAGYAAEILTNPVAAALALFAALPAAEAAAGAAALLSYRCVCDAAMERRLGVARPLARYLPLLVLKESLILTLWAVPFLGRGVAWRGDRYRIGPRTRLEPASAPRSDPVLADFAPDIAGDPIAWTA